MHIKAHIHEITAPSVNASQSMRKGDSIKSLVTKMPESAMTGIDSRKEKRAAASLVKPSIIPAVIVAPDLEVPGISAIA